MLQADHELKMNAERKAKYGDKLIELETKFPEKFKGMTYDDKLKLIEK